MARKRLPPRRTPIEQSMRQLSALRAQPEYATGELIDEAACAAFAVAQAVAGQHNRRSVPRQMRYDIHADVQAETQSSDQLIAPRVIGAVMLSPFMHLEAAFSAIRTEALTP